MKILDSKTIKTREFFKTYGTIDVETNRFYVIFDRNSEDNYRVRIYDKKLREDLEDTTMTFEDAYRVYRHHVVFYGFEDHDVSVMPWN